MMSNALFLFVFNVVLLLELIVMRVFHGGYIKFAKFPATFPCLSKIHIMKT